MQTKKKTKTSTMIKTKKHTGPKQAKPKRTNTKTRPGMRTGHLETKTKTATKSIQEKDHTIQSPYQDNNKV